jgi:uncharacterized repeat protein (TIGR03803 family)
MASRGQHCIWIRGASRCTFAPWLPLVMVLLLAGIATQTGHAQAFTVIKNFSGGGDGADPRAGLTKDAAGNFYGTTREGGRYGFGTVFKLAQNGPTWILTPIYSFAGGNDGAYPDAKVVFGPQGGLYGSTSVGGGTSCGGSGCGTIFRLTPPASACKSAICTWNETVLYRFMGGSDGEGPSYSDLIFDSAGNMYGTTRFGGGMADAGTVFQLMNGTWTENVIHTFGQATDGANPNSGVIFDNVGNLYGTTYFGGTSGVGTVYQLTPSGPGWTENVLYNFQGLDDGEVPACGLTFDPMGNLFGATAAAGANGGGTFFELTGGDWMFGVLYPFSSGTGPYASLTIDAAGNFYGTTFAGGAFGFGSVFKLTYSGGSWTSSTLHDFTGGNDGANPQSTPVFDAVGNLYGTTRAGGAYGNGTIFQLAP